MTRIKAKLMLGLLAASLLSAANMAHADLSNPQQALSPANAQYMPGARIMNDWSPPLQSWAPTQAEMKMLQSDLAKTRSADRQKFSYTNQKFTFKSITPCRLIDTRSAAQGGAVGSGGTLDGGAFTAGQTRSYNIGGACGIQFFPGSIDSAGVVANLFAQPVGGTSGDIEAGSSITGTAVSLVYNGGNANYQVAGTTITTNTSGGFSIQNRFGSANVVVDVVGYFTDGDPAASTPQPPGDFFNDSGDAVKIAGTLGVVGAGTSNSTVASFAIKHTVVAGTFGSGGTLCGSTAFSGVPGNSALLNNPSALVYVTQYSISTTLTTPVSVYYGSCISDGNARWLVRRNDGSAHVAGDVFNILVVQPR